MQIYSAKLEENWFKSGATQLSTIHINEAITNLGWVVGSFQLHMKLGRNGRLTLLLEPVDKSVFEHLNMYHVLLMIDFISEVREWVRDIFSWSTGCHTNELSPPWSAAGDTFILSKKKKKKKKLKYFAKIWSKHGKYLKK